MGSDDYFEAVAHRGGRGIALLKVVASSVLLARTLGFLWHDRSPPMDWPNIPPPFLLKIASGWYSDVFWTAFHLVDHSVASATVYLVVCLFCVVALFAAPFIGSTPWRLVFGVFLAFGIGYDLALFDIGGQIPSFAMTQAIIVTIGQPGINGTAEAYFTPIAVNVALASVGLAVFALPPPSLRGKLRHLPLAMCVTAVAGVGGILIRTDVYTRDFPSPFGSYANALSAMLGGGRTDIAGLSYSGTPSPSLRKIIFVIDESVRGDFLSINDQSVKTTPFLVSIRDKISNFGIAVAGANCSYQSRMMMRFGVQQSDIEKANDPQFPGPTIWQYARGAGFQTAYIDSYGSDTKLANGMTRTELAFVDHHVVVDNMPPYLKDPTIPGRLRKLLDDPDPMFILIEKYGSHVPYNSAYPEAENVFDAPNDRNFDPSDRPKLVKQYQDAIRWSVDKFFASLLAQPLPAGTLLLYTSDHGQALAENNRLQTHCSSGRLAVLNEANVPLFAITSDPSWQKSLSAAATNNANRASTLDIFPTLLAALGYDAGWIRRNFQYSLLAPIGAKRKRLFWAMTGSRRYDH